MGAVRSTVTHTPGAGQTSGEGGCHPLCPSGPPLVCSPRSRVPSDRVQDVPRLLGGSTIRRVTCPGARRVQLLISTHPTPRERLRRVLVVSKDVCVFSSVTCLLFTTVSYFDYSDEECTVGLAFRHPRHFSSATDRHRSTRFV